MVCPIPGKDGNPLKTKYNRPENTVEELDTGRCVDAPT